VHQLNFYILQWCIWIFWTIIWS